MLQTARAAKPALSCEVITLRLATLRIFVPSPLITAFGLQLFRLMGSGAVGFHV
jgi:hypothetical protein